MSYEGDKYYDGAVVSGTALGKTSTGKVQLGITFKLPDGGSITAYRFFSDAALPYTEEDLRTLGWDPVQEGWNIDDLVMNSRIVGAMVDLVCGMEEYNGKERMKVKFINAPGGGGVLKEKLSDEEARAFTAQLRQKLGATGGVKARPAAAARTKPVYVPPLSDSPAAADDEIPF